MPRRAVGKAPRVTKVGLCVFVITLALLASFFGLVHLLLAMFGNGSEETPLSDPRGTFGRSLFVPSFAPGAEAVIDLADTTLTKLHPDAAQCPWLVVFYGDGCGHCRSAAPRLAAFASQWTKNAAVVHGAAETATLPAASAARSLVQVAALNCREFNQPCRQHHIRGVPTIKVLFPSEAGDAERGRAGYATGFTEVEVDPSSYSYKDMSAAVVGALAQHAPSYSTTAMERCLQVREALLAAKHTRLNPPNTATPGTVSEAPPKAAAGQTPSNRSHKGKCAVSDEDCEESEGLDMDDDNGESSVAANFTEERDVYPTDIANSFFQTLHDEVALVGFDSVEQRQALMNFLAVVDAALPGLGAGVPLHYLRTKAPTLAPRHPAFTSEAGEEGAVAANSGSSGASRPPQMRTNVTEWQQTVLHAGIPYRGNPGRLAWRTCKGSQWMYRGFPCGMWLLYHSLTANYEGGLMSPWDGMTSLEVLPVILDYARHYFSCSVCREHFLMFKPQEGPTSRESAVLQLWRVHNIANYNLAKSPAGQDPLVPKRPFPDSALCPPCVSGTSTTAPMRVWTGPRSSASGAEGAESVEVFTTFNEEAVVTFLLERYAWDPTTLHADEVKERKASARVEAAVAAAAAAAARGDEVITVYRRPMSTDILLTIVAVVGFVGLGCARVLRAGTGRSSRSAWTGLPQETAPAQEKAAQPPMAGPGLISHVYGVERKR